MNGSYCNVCGVEATIRDMEYDEYYCDEHARSYQVDQGPHEVLATHEEVPPEDPRPWTITIEVTQECRGAQEAEALGAQIVDYLASSYDGIAGAVMNVEPNWEEA